eukprot:scaffold13735_cov99-Isochrysis_galbana.AAC.2
MQAISPFPLRSAHAGNSSYPTPRVAPHRGPSPLSTDRLSPWFSSYSPLSLARCRSAVPWNAAPSPAPHGVSRNDVSADHPTPCRASRCRPPGACTRAAHLSA